MLIVIGLWLFARAMRGQTHSHGEGLVVGVIAGLIPCPLTFAMLLALSRGVPEAGLTFAAAMMFGVAFTLGAVATGTILARDWILKFIEQHGGSVERISRGLDALSGLLLLLIGVRQFLS
jgi:ABC-type nickel/cobalt efflux system permease component RcnA